MKIITHTDNIPQPTVATIGFFDGVHLGRFYERLQEKLSALEG